MQTSESTSKLAQEDRLDDSNVKRSTALSELEEGDLPANYIKPDLNHNQLSD